MSEKKVTDIQARHDAAGDGRRMDIGEGWQAHEDRGELLDEIREAAAVLVALGIPAAGRTLAERIGALWSHVLLARPRTEADREKARAARKEQEEAEERIDRFMAETATPTKTIKMVREDKVAEMLAAEREKGCEEGAHAARANDDPTGVWARLDVLAGKVVAGGEKMEADRAAKRGTAAPEPLTASPCAICGRTGLDHDYHPDEPSDIWPIDALVYCKVCHKTHAAQAGEKMCGGPGSWIVE